VPRHAAASSLYPYPTLFRSLAADAAPGDVLLEPSMLLDPDHPSPFPLLAGRPVYLSLLSHALYLPEDVREARFADVATVFSAPEDRKSTRLNSSHVKSSYAV